MKTIEKLLDWLVRWLIRLAVLISPILAFVVADCGGLDGLIWLALGLALASFGYWIELWRKSMSWIPNDVQKETEPWTRFFLPIGFVAVFVGLLLVKTHVMAGGTTGIILERLGSENSVLIPTWVWTSVGGLMLVASLIGEIKWFIKEPLGNWAFAIRMWAEGSSSVGEYHRKVAKKRAEKQLKKLLGQHNHDH